MTERTRDWLQQWLNPHTLITLVSFVLLLGGAWFRLGAVEKQLEALQAQSTTSQTATQATVQAATTELVRYQERISAMGDRVRVLEQKASDQESINVRVFSGLSKLGG